MRILLFVVAMIVLIGMEMLRVYFIMPFPGSQQDEAVRLAYFLNQNINYFRAGGILLVAFPVYVFFRNGSQTMKIITTVVLAFYGFVFYSFNFRFLADAIFLPIENKSFATLAGNNVVEKQLVLGVSIRNESKAYPLEIIGYHHQVRDTLAGEPIMITYCTVCRTGRVYQPTINGKPEVFRLVGMDHYNAMFEDKTTGSWWRQVSGEAIVGPLTGQMLAEVPSEQMTLSAWVNQHPETLILQPDTIFKEAYKELENYDEGKMTGRLESKDSLSWKDKSWVVGVQVGSQSRAYDWIELQSTRLIEDTLASTLLLVVIEPDSASFHVFNRMVNMDSLSFSIINNGSNLQDSKTKSIWGWNGRCVDGEMKGTALTVRQSYQEYWHSWRMFRGEGAYNKNESGH